MPAPVATIANLTATGDVIIGPGGLTTMVKGRPTACLGSLVTGISMLGFPISTAVMLCPNVNEII